MKIELEEGENAPPPEYRRMGPNMLAICAEQLKEFLKAGWIYKGAARTAAPVLMVKKPNADLKCGVPQELFVCENLVERPIVQKMQTGKLQIFLYAFPQ
jgi:hypothetical protein